MNKTIKKIDTLLTEIGKRSVCAVCGAQPAWLHHLLPKSTHPWLRAVVENLLPLCDEHHTLSNDLAAHSSNWRGQVAFAAWLSTHTNCYLWINNQIFPPTSAIDWEQELATLQERQHEIK